MVNMQALSSYSREKDAAIQPALQAMEDRQLGLTADSYFSERGLFARFVWPDWPQDLSEKLAAEVRAFRSQYQLLPVDEGSDDWNGVFHGWRSDETSARAIASAFRKYFGQRLLWVESQRDIRGRIAAECMIKDLVQAQPVAPGADSPMHKLMRESLARREETPISLQLFWKDPMALPPGPMSNTDRELFRASTYEVFAWAGQRVRPILDALHDKLKRLYGERFRDLYVFGSYARPDAGVELPEDSDLDVAVILSEFENAYDEIRRFGDITADLSLEHSLVISVVPVREADYRERRTNFTRVISEYAIKV